MGIITHQKVLLALPVVLALLTPVISTLQCPKGKQYLHHELQKCMNCTQCDHTQKLLVLRPCDFHQDTLCGPLSKLIDVLHPENRHRHQKHHHNHRLNKDHRLWDGTSQQPDDLSDIIAVTSTEAPFSSVEALVWDWQAVALTFAVFSCILFFLVIALYSLHQAKQWRRLKENFEADVEELSARLSLMAANSSEKGEVLEPSFGPIRDSNYLNNRCMYLEQLLHVRKDKGPGTESGNVYIEESNTSGKT